MQDTTETMPLSLPSKTLVMSELLRATKETFTLPYKLVSLIHSTPAVEKVPVLLLPGYGGGDGSMFALKYALKSIGCDTYDFNQGRNLESRNERIMRIEDAVRFRKKMSDLAVDRLHEIYNSTGKKAVVVGWSMGGCYGLDASQLAPQYIQQVITLGSPFGDPRGTSMWKVMRKLSRSKVPVEDMDFNQWLSMCQVEENHVKLDVIYSEDDGIVSTDIAKLSENQANISHHKVKSSHIGFAVNHKAIKTVLHLVASHEHQEKVMETCRV